MEGQHQRHSDTSDPVSRLLRVKCAEKPPEAFWENFENELHRKLVRTMVEDQRPVRRLSRFLRGVADSWPLASGLAAASFAVVAVGFTAIRPGEAPERSETAADIAQEPVAGSVSERQFVVDVIEIPSDGRSTESGRALASMDVVRSDSSDAVFVMETYSTGSPPSGRGGDTLLFLN